MSRPWTLALFALFIVSGTSAARDDPEPPGATQFRHLVGKWRSVRLVSKGRVTQRSTIVYDFRQDGFSYSGDVITYKGTLKVVSTGEPLVLAMTREKSTTTVHSATRIEKDLLYLAVFPSNEVPKRVDFSGNQYSVLVLKREK